MNEKKNSFKNDIWMKSSLFLFLITGALFLGCFTVDAATAKPIVLTKKINDQTSTVQVYVPGNHILYVSLGTKTLARESAAPGIKTVTISKQAAGRKVKFYLKDKKTGKKGKTVTVAVKKFASQKQSGKIKKPSVQKTITSRTTSVSVKGYKGTTLIIKNSSLQTVAKKKFTKTAAQKIKIKAQNITAQTGNRLYFYLTKSGKRGSVVSKIIKDKTAPQKPTVSIVSGKLAVTGEIGTTVYVAENSGEYSNKGVIIAKNGLSIPYVSEKTYSIKLEDTAGNTSAVTKIAAKKDPDHSSGQNSPPVDDTQEAPCSHTWTTKKYVKNLYTRNAVSWFSLMDIRLFGRKIREKYNVPLSSAQEISLIGNVESGIHSAYSIEDLRAFKNASGIVEDILKRVVYEPYLDDFGLTAEQVLSVWAEEMDTWPGHLDWLCWANINHRYWPYNKGLDTDTIAGYYSSGCWGEGFIGQVLVGQIIVEQNVCSKCGAKEFIDYGEFGNFDYAKHGIPNNWIIIEDSMLYRYDPDGETPNLPVDSEGSFNLGILKAS